MLSALRRHALFELVFTVAVAVGLAFAVQAWAVKPYKIPTGSMEPTLTEGQRILVDRLVFSPHVGQIVVFHPPHGADLADGVCANPNQGPGHPQPCDDPTPQESSQTFIKRVVGGPGDVISIVDGHVYRNGKPEKDAYTIQCGPGNPACEFSESIKVPPGDYFMMGDNRPDSDDSRFWGPVPARWMIGDAFFTYWPLGRIGLF